MMLQPQSQETTFLVIEKALANGDACVKKEEGNSGIQGGQEMKHSDRLAARDLDFTLLGCSITAEPQG